MNQTTVYLYNDEITHIEYGSMGRLNSASNIMTIISNYLPEWDMGATFILPNGRVTKKYKAFLEDTSNDITEDISIDITEDLATTGGLPESVVGEEWCVRTLPIPSTILNTAFSAYAENLTFSINLSKCTAYATDADDNEYCTRWARINTETKNLAILPSVVGGYEDIEVDLGSVQDELSNLYNKMDIVFGDYVDSNGDVTDIPGKVDKVAGSSLVTDAEITYLNDLGVKQIAQAGRLTDNEEDIASLESSTSNIDNTSDIDKPVSSAQQTALDLKVPKTLTIMNLPLDNNILRNGFISALGEVTTENTSGLMSSADKSRLDALHALLDESDETNDVVNTINEVLAIFNQYPEGEDILSRFADKVDKATGYTLTQNDLTDIIKDRYDTAYTHSQITDANPHDVKFNDLLSKPTTIDGIGITDAHTKAYIDGLATLNGWKSSLLTATALGNADTIPTSTLFDKNKLTFICKNTTTGEIDTDELVGASIVTDTKLVFFDNADVYLTVGAADTTFTVTGTYELIIYGFEISEQIAEDIVYDGTQNVKQAIDSNKQDIMVTELEVATNKQNIGTQSHAITTIEEDLRKQSDGEVTRVISGEEVINMPKDTASGPLEVKLEGMSFYENDVLQSVAFDKRIRSYNEDESIHTDMYIQGGGQGYSAGDVKDSVEYRDGKYYKNNRVGTVSSIDTAITELNELSLKEVFEDGLLTSVTASYNGDGTALNAVDGEEFYFIILNGVTSIGDYAFDDFNSIGQVVIPNSVTSIGDYAFESWTLATAFIMERTTPPAIETGAFDNSNNAPIYVPDESVTEYKTATNWTAYADRIFALSERVI